MLLSQINSGAPVDEHLVDNILPWLALSSGKIKAAKITNHALTNIYVIEKFLGKLFEVNKEERIISSKLS